MMYNMTEIIDGMMGLNPHEWIGGFGPIGSRNWQGTCLEIIMCMWNARMTRWLGGEIT
jgi:hypothetical protein